MKYLALDGYLKYQDEERGRPRDISGYVYCAALGQLYKLEEDSDIAHIIHKDGEFMTEHKSFKRGTIILITYNDDIIDITDGNRMSEYITEVVDERIQMRNKAEQSECGCKDSCAG